MSKQVYRDGKWQEGKAAPEHLREDLRELPGELVTKDTTDKDKIHELDPPHIHDALKNEYAKKVEAEEKKDSEVDWVRRELNHAAEQRFPLTRRLVDLARLNVMRNLVNSLSAHISMGKDFDMSVRHIWFDYNNLLCITMRPGNPPPDSQRPHYLRGYDLWLDFRDPIPKSLRAEIMRSKERMKRFEKGVQMSLLRAHARGVDLSPLAEQGENYERDTQLVTTH